MTEAISFDFSGVRASAPIDDVRDFVQCLADQPYVGAQKRASPRQRLAIEVPAIPLNSQLQQAGEPFVAMSRDISTGGIRLVHTMHVSAPFLLIELESGDNVRLQIVTKVLRCRQLKRFFELAGQFVARR
jgi:hypothetical protein